MNRRFTGGVSGGDRLCHCGGRRIVRLRRFKSVPDLLAFQSHTSRAQSHRPEDVSIWEKWDGSGASGGPAPPPRFRLQEVKLPMRL